MRVVPNPGGGSTIETCECKVEQRPAKIVKRAGIPTRYANCSLDSFETKFLGADPSLASAHVMARSFVDGYPVTTEGKGLLLIGPVGVGKTHLAVAILRALIAEKSARGIFRDFRDLLREVGNSYNPLVPETEMDLLRPLFTAEILVLDELGAGRANEWILSTVALILNRRYNNKLTTIITTNFEDLPGAEPEPDGFTDADMVKRSKLAARQQTLGDRIGETMRSRLAEMCVSVKMRGKDFRQGAGRARFG